MNLNTPQINPGPITAADFVRSPAPRIPRGCDQQGRYPMAFHAAEACTEVGADDDAKTWEESAIAWLTPSRFWTLYVLTFVGAMLAVWMVLA